MERSVFMCAKRSKNGGNGKRKIVCLIVLLILVVVACVGFVVFKFFVSKKDDNRGVESVQTSATNEEISVEEERVVEKVDIVDLNSTKAFIILMLASILMQVAVEQYLNGFSRSF